MVRVESLRTLEREIRKWFDMKKRMTYYEGRTQVEVCCGNAKLHVGVGNEE